MGSHVDDGDLKDWTFTPDGRSSFRVNFHLSGTTGQAMVTVRNTKLLWKMINKQPKDEGEPLTSSFSPPETAVLTRQRPDQVRHPPAC